MELYQWNAFSEGAGLHRKDDLASIAQGAFLVAYWAMSKHTKSLQSVLNEIYGKSENTSQKHMDTVDVEAFLEMKRRFGIDD